MKRAVFLDRDGVINEYVTHPEFGTVDSPANPAEVRLLPGVAEAICRLNAMAFEVIIVSNQPGIAKARFSDELLAAMTRAMEEMLRQGGGYIDAVYYCRHHPEASRPELRSVCSCRKPKPGLIMQAAADRFIDLRNSFMVGDGVVDVLAGQAAGVATIFVSPRRCYVCDELSRQKAQPDYLVSNLNQAAELVEALARNNSVIVDNFRFHACISQENL
jgi:D-glycero-D-manno-heptose 1,7-bisphosphate phosphatase